MAGFSHPLSAVLASVNGKSTKDKLAVNKRSPTRSISFIFLIIPPIHVSACEACRDRES